MCIRDSHPGGKFFALISLIGPDPTHGGYAVKQRPEQEVRPLTVVDVGGMDPHGQNTTGGIGYDEMFSTLHFLPAVKTRFLGGFGRTLDALAVDDSRARLLGSTVFFRTLRRTSAFTRAKKPFADHFV